MAEYGRVHAYYGEGKGKTSASIGLAIRMLGAGNQVDFVQFMKNGSSSEIAVLKAIPGLNYFCPGEFAWAYQDKPFSAQQLEHAMQALEFAIASSRGIAQLLVCDEILNVPLYGDGVRAFGIEEIIELVRSKRGDLELVLTGLACPPSLLQYVDYATELKKIKHPYDSGLLARPGIEY